MADKKTDHCLILELHKAWINAELGSRVDDLLALCTQDVVIQPPLGAAVSGRDQARAFFLGAAGQIEEIEIGDVSLEVSTELAVKRARFRTHLAAQPAPVSGTHLWVLRPRWKVAFITWSLDRYSGD